MPQTSEWLHFSDFHFGRQNSPQRVAVLELLGHLRYDLRRRPGKISAIFLVGDIANSGDAVEYRNFEKDFLNPLLDIPELADSKIFAVPGNHDVACNYGIPITWEGIQKRNQATFFTESDEGRRIRQERAKVFTAYRDFVQRRKIHSPDPFTQVSNYYSFQDLPFDLALTNTSFFCDKDERSDLPITPSPIDSLIETLSGRNPSRPLFVLGHHPITNLLPEQQRRFQTFIENNYGVYLHGHEHNPKPTFNVQGSVCTVGFGATYLAPLGETHINPYCNSYARCRVGHVFEVSSFSWNHHTGNWEDATVRHFAPSMAATRPLDNWLTLTLPAEVRSRSVSSGIVASADSLRKPCIPQSIIPVDVSNQGLWEKFVGLTHQYHLIFESSSHIKIRQVVEIDGKREFVLDQSPRRALVICMPAATHVLSATEVETFNTRLDTEDYDAVIVISLGKISSAARDIYNRLRAKKPLEIIGNADLTSRWDSLLSIAQKERLAALRIDFDAAHLLLESDQIYLLVLNHEDQQSFEIYDDPGRLLPSSHSAIADLRLRAPTFTHLPYRGEDPAALTEPVTLEFNPSDYLSRCHKEYNSIKYAALANIGLRFSDFSLEEIYIEASACEVDAAQSTRAEAVLDDHLSAYPLSDGLRAQIKEHLLSQSQESQSYEASRAREFCQKFGAVLLTGDPGSGKTCFVKSEILAYCKRVTTQSEPVDSAELANWHSEHIPVLIQLSQAAAEPDLESSGLLRIAARLLERRGFTIPYSTLSELLHSGKLALFFDGLDEIVSVEKRAIVVNYINEIVTNYQHIGNRIVVTSRPAVVNVVNLLPSLRKLELQGLTRDEISKLARRILTLRISETEAGLTLQEGQNRSQDSATIQQLLADCAEKPGVARFATNPLLLTLLVMIYANSGAPSAKRHKIYAEAVQTLASVRGRQVGHSPMSVQDLRDRLGPVALSVYRKASGFLPTKNEVVAIVRGVMEKQRGTTVPDNEASSFVQRVAESTGLIAFSGDDSHGNGSAVVSFMHHSFMEYFAAVGINRELPFIDARELISKPRWKEVLTLLTGIIGESSDITPVLAKFVSNGEHYGEVDARYLIFALDCALECEVPSEASVRLLCATVSNCVVFGPAKVDPWIRAEIGERLCQLIAACGMIEFESLLSTLIDDDRQDVCSAGISLAGLACESTIKSQRVLDAVKQAASTRQEETVLSAICEAFGRVSWLRVPITEQIVVKCLKKSTRSKRLAFDAILSTPGLPSKCWLDIVNCFKDPSPVVRRLACRTALQAGFEGDISAFSTERRDHLVSALQTQADSQHALDYQGHRIRFDVVLPYLNSGYQRDRIFGIQLLPASDAGGSVIRSQLMNILENSRDNVEFTAALQALRSSPDARNLLVTSDIKRISRLARDGTAEVRRASIMLLGCFGAEAVAVSALLILNYQTMDLVESKAAFYALGHAKTKKTDVVELIGRELFTWTRRTVRKTKYYEGALVAILNAARFLGTNFPPDITDRMRSLINGTSHKKSIRGAALQAYAATVYPSRFAVEYLTELLLNPPAGFARDLAKAISAFATNCKQSADNVIKCVEPMPAMRDAARELHGRILNKGLAPENEFLITELRAGISELSEIIVTFEEFIKDTVPS